MMPTPSKTPLTDTMARLGKCLCSLLILSAFGAWCQEAPDPLAEPRTLLSNGKLKEAGAALHSYLKEHPAFAEAHFLLGYVLFREQKPVESLAEFTAGAHIRRPKANEFKTVASDYVLLGDFADAEKWFTEVTLESPDDANVWYLLGRTKYNESNFPEAVSTFEHALALDPKYVEAENNLGLALRGLNNTDKAKAAFQAAIDWQGNSPTDAQPFLNLGTLLVDQNEFEASIPYLEKAEQLSPENPKIHEELGQVYEAQKNLPKAQGELEQAVALASNTSGLHFRLGQIYRREGLRDRAQHEFDLCEKLNSTHSSGSTPNPLGPNQPAPR